MGGDPAGRCWPAPAWPSTYQRRLPLYAGVATLTVATDGRRPEAVSQDILARLVSQPAHGGRALVCPAGAG